MRKKYLNLLLLLATSPLLIQCVAAERDVRSLDLRTRSQNMRLSEIEQNQQTLINQSGAQADLHDSIERLNSRLLQIEGKLDESTHTTRLVKEESRQRQSDVNSIINDLQNHIALMRTDVDSMKKMLDVLAKNSQEAQAIAGQNAAAIDAIRKSQAKEAADRALAASRAAEQARLAAQRKTEEKPEMTPRQVKKKADDEVDGSTAASSPQPAEPQKIEAPRASGVAGEVALYDKAYDQFKNKSYKQSYSLFSEFLDKYPKSDRAPSARFWLGDSLYNQAEYELAILEYQKIIADYSKHSKAPAALLKQGLAFEKLKESQTAKIVYEKLIKDYPKSEQAPAAQKRLEELR